MWRESAIYWRLNQLQTLETEWNTSSTASLLSLLKPTWVRVLLLYVCLCAPLASLQHSDSHVHLCPGPKASRPDISVRGREPPAGRAPLPGDGGFRESGGLLQIWPGGLSLQGRGMRQGAAGHGRRVWLLWTGWRKISKTYLIYVEICKLKSLYGMKAVFFDCKRYLVTLMLRFFSFCN